MPHGTAQATAPCSPRTAGYSMGHRSPRGWGLSSRLGGLGSGGSPGMTAIGREKLERKRRLEELQRQQRKKTIAKHAERAVRRMVEQQLARGWQALAVKIRASTPIPRQRRGERLAIEINKRKVRPAQTWPTYGRPARVSRGAARRARFITFHGFSGVTALRPAIYRR